LSPTERSFRRDAPRLTLSVSTEASSGGHREPQPESRHRHRRVARDRSRPRRRLPRAWLRRRPHLPQPPPPPPPPACHPPRRDRATPARGLAAAKDRFGRIDTLVNNAGIFVPKPFVEYTQEDFDRVSGINVTGVFHITQLVLAEMLAAGSGHVVNITASLVA